MNHYLLGLAAIIVFVASIFRMADPTIPTPQDTSLLLQDTVTKTATFSSTALDLGSGFSPGGRGQSVAAVLQTTAFDFTTGDETYSFVIEQSASSGSGFTACGAAVSVTATGVVTLKGFLTQQYVRITLTAAGTTPSITYKAWLNPL